MNVSNIPPSKDLRTDILNDLKPIIKIFEESGGRCYQIRNTIKFFNLPDYTRFIVLTTKSDVCVLDFPHPYMSIDGCFILKFYERTSVTYDL